MRIVIRMKSAKNLILNEDILGYVPHSTDPNRVVDYEYNLQIHFPHNYDRENAERCVLNLKQLLLFEFEEFDYKTVRLVRHKPYDRAYFHHVPTEWVAKIPEDSLAYHIYSSYLAGKIRTKNKEEFYDDSVNPKDVFTTNKDSKPIK